MTLRQCIENTSGYPYTLNLDELLDDISMYNIDFIVINVIDIIKNYPNGTMDVIDRLIGLKKFNDNLVFANNKLLMILLHLNFDLKVFMVVLKIFHREMEVLPHHAVHLVSFKLSQELLPVLLNIANYDLLTNSTEYIELICHLIPMAANKDEHVSGCEIPNVFLIEICNVLKQDLESDAVDAIIHLLLVINELFCMKSPENNPIPFLINSKIINKIIVKFNRFNLEDNKILCLKLMNDLVCSNSIHLYLNDLLVFKDILVRDFIESQSEDFNYSVILLKVLNKILIYLKKNEQYKLVLDTIKALKQNNLDDNQPNTAVLKNMLAEISKLDDRPAVPGRRKR